MDKMIGKSFPWTKRIKMKGIGCSKMIINMASTEIAELLGDVNDMQYCNIELRPKGIIVGFNARMTIYSWLIPYHFLTIYNSQSLVSIYSNDNHMKLKPRASGKIDQEFMIKLLEKKAEYMMENFRR